jgi:carboxylesterase
MTRPTVVLVHGLGGSPASLGELPDAITRAGYVVLTPTLPGHATSVDDLECVGLPDWLTTLTAVAAGRGPTVIIGQSLGGVLALVVGAQTPEVIAVGLINAPVTPADPDVVEHLHWMSERGVRRQPCGPPDLRDPHATDPSYDELPLRALCDLMSAGDLAWQAAPTFTRPTLIVTSDHDQVVDPALGDQLEAAVAGAVTRRRLPNSGHVACRDLDRQVLAAEITTWLAQLSAAWT